VEKGSGAQGQRGAAGKRHRGIKAQGHRGIITGNCLNSEIDKL